MYKDFKDYILSEVEEFCLELSSYELVPSIIGGTSRDFLLNQVNKHDYDIEIRPKENLTQDKLLNIFDLLQKSLSKIYEVEELPYSILKIKLPNCTVEITMPREEFYKDEFSHSNFDVAYMSDLDFTLGGIRRDFTINAISFVLKDESWGCVDPLNGKKDLENRILRPCSEDFTKDPVRYLRAIRFSMLYNFTIDKQILEDFSELELDNFTAHYLRYEAMKSNRPISFLLKLIELLQEGSYSSLITELAAIDKVETSLKDHLTSLIHLDYELREDLAECLDYSFKLINFDLPVLFKKLKYKSFNEFILLAEQIHLLDIYRTLQRINSRYVDFLNANDYIDLTPSDLNLMKEHLVDLSEIENTDKKFYQLYERLNFLRD